MLKSILLALIGYCIIVNPTFCQEYQITEDPAWAEHPSWSPDGKMVAFESFRFGHRNIWIIPEIDGEDDTVRITNHPADDFQPCWSPDGETIVFWSGRGNNADIWLYHFDGDSVSRLTTHDSADYYPKWSHDGSQIVFVSHRGGDKPDIWVMSSTGGDIRRVTDDEYGNWAPTFSPDGSEIAYQSERGGPGNVWRIPVVGGDPVQVTTEGGGAPSWSIDNVIAFSSNRDEGTHDLYTINPDGTDLKRITTHPAGDFNCEWSRDGVKLCYTSTRSGTDDVWGIVVNQFISIADVDVVTDVGHSWSVNWVDYDNDDFQDLFVSNLDVDNALYHNDGNGLFTKVIGLDLTVNTGGISSSGASWCDWDNNGHSDIFMATFLEGSPPVNRAFLNNGDGSFTQLENSQIVTDAGMSIEPSWADYDNDGDLDLYVANHSSFNYLYRQDDTGFAAITDQPLCTEYTESNSTSWCDYDNDGDMDVISINAWMDQYDNLYSNNGDGEFTEIVDGDVVTTAYDSWGGSWGDCDNDGDMDLFITSSIWGNPSASFDYLYQNNGDGTFSALTSSLPSITGAYTFGSAWGDYDNDGDLDLVAVAEGQNLLYENLGGMAFELITEGSVVIDVHSSHGGAWCDYDKDGDLDLYVTNVGANDMYLNSGNINKWMNIKCVGTNSNKSAVGAKVRLRATINSTPVWQMREISCKTGKNGQNSIYAHFGIGDASIIDTIRIQWPSGMVDVYTDINPNQFITYTETICGDADSNSNINILDITFLISYLYKDGPAPQHMQAADADGSGTINILDITYLISYLYKEGVRPICIS